MFDRIYQQNTLRRPTLSQRDWWVYGPPYGSYPLSWIDFYGTYSNIGSSRVTMCNKTGPWHPGKFAVNPIDQRSFTASSGGGLLKLEWIYGGTRVTTREISGDLAAYVSGPPADLTHPVVQDVKLQNLALQQASAKLAQPDADVGLMLAELGQTIQLLVSPVSFLKKKLTQLLRRRKRPPRKGPPNLQYFTDKWLELRYGVIPLIQDIEDVRDLVNKKLNLDLGHIYSKGRSLGSGTTSSSSKRTANLFGGTFNIVDNMVNDGRVNARIYYRVVNENLYRMVRVGLSPYQIANLAWEKVPFSFVFDWAIDFGSWLSSIQPKPHIQEISTCVSFKITQENHTNVWSFDYGMGRANVSSTYDVSTQKFYRIIGQPVTGVPLVNPSIMNVLRAIDSASLAWGKVSSVLKNFK